MPIAVRTLLPDESGEDMADRSLDIDSIADVLGKAKLALDDAVQRVFRTDPNLAALVAARLRAAADNNSTCNTACTCGALAEMEGPEGRG